jgi:DNA-binding transcriptional ArsR family regulator
MASHSEEAARLLRALANPQRLRILCMLVGQELTVGRINENLPD